MPTYSYKCTECDHQFDTVHSMSAESLKDCPECSQETLRKVIFAPAISFKGSGFYVTDNKKDSTVPAPSSVKKEPSSSTTDKKEACQKCPSESCPAKA